jgi:hypothetical protein
MPQREEIVQQALDLPPEDRAFVAAALEYSLATESKGSLPASADPASRAMVEGGEFFGGITAAVGGVARGPDDHPASYRGAGGFAPTPSC